MKLCKDCAHLQPDGLFCESPENGLNLVDGKPRRLFACLQRLDDSLAFHSAPRCGPEAKHFQQKQPQQNRVWWKFWKPEVKD